MISRNLQDAFHLVGTQQIVMIIYILVYCYHNVSKRLKVHAIYVAIVTLTFYCYSLAYILRTRSWKHYSRSISYKVML